MNFLNLTGKPTEEGEMMDDNENKKVTFREESEPSMEGRKSTISKSSSYTQISIAHIGRPIAQVSRVPDPVSNQISLGNIFQKYCIHVLVFHFGNCFSIIGIKYAGIWIIFLYLIFKVNGCGVWIWMIS